MDSLTHKPKIDKRKGQALLPIPRVKPNISETFLQYYYNTLFKLMCPFFVPFLSLFAKNPTLHQSHPLLSNTTSRKSPKEPTRSTSAQMSLRSLVDPHTPYKTTSPP